MSTQRIGTDAIVKTIMGIIGIAVSLVITYYITDFIGIGDWIRGNTVWVITFIILSAVVLLESDISGNSELLTDNMANLKEMLEKIETLELDIDYIKNTVKELKKGIGPL